MDFLCSISTKLSVIADEAQEKSGASSTSVNVAIDESTPPKEVISVVGQPVYQNEGVDVRVYAAPEPAPITVDN